MMKNNKGKSYLLDTSIQVKRLISAKWAHRGLNSIWENVTPVASLYSLMEFKNSVICALKFLINILQEIEASGNIDNKVEVRLNEIIMLINMDSGVRNTERRTKLANAYASKILEENRLYPKERSISEVVEQLKIEADNLQNIWFFYYSENNRPQKMKTLNSISCYLAMNLNPIHNETYTCKKEKMECKVKEFAIRNCLCGIRKDIDDKRLRLNSTRLKKGIEALCEKLREGELQDDRSVGQFLCWPVGDCLLGLKAKSENIGILTADRDLISLANHYNMKSIFYDSKLNTFV